MVGKETGTLTGKKSEYHIANTNLSIVWQNLMGSLTSIFLEAIRRLHGVSKIM